MNAPAVPNYVVRAAEGFADCPAGHCFSLYFPMWEIDKKGGAEVDALRKSLKLGSAAKTLEALNRRQKTLADALSADQCFILEARSTSPFATGLGLEHPIENGFAFLSPYGLPYLAGSGVKGVLRRAAEELRDDAKVITQPVIDALFGHEKDDDARRGALTCWDVFPVPPKDGPHKDSLVVEIMTPHFNDYYQGNSAPHDAGKLNLIHFLAVPADSQFHFVITCELKLLTATVPQDEWKTLIGKIVEHAFDWLGFGAKTSVGYGAMKEDQRAKAERERKQREIEEKAQHQQQEAARQQALLSMSPAERAMREFLDDRTDKNQLELNALLDGLKKSRWDGNLKIEIAGHVKTRMQAAKKWKEKSEKKNPEKDRDYQDTLRVMNWIKGG